MEFECDICKNYDGSINYLVHDKSLNKEDEDPHLYIKWLVCPECKSVYKMYNWGSCNADYVVKG